MRCFMEELFFGGVRNLNKIYIVGCNKAIVIGLFAEPTIKLCSNIVKIDLL